MGIKGDEREETKDTAGAKHSGSPRVAGGLQPTWQHINDQRPVNGLDYALEGGLTGEARQELRETCLRLSRSP